MPLAFLTLPVPAAPWPPPAPTLVQRLVFSLRELHRPEVADLLLSGTVSLAGRVLLVEMDPRSWAEIPAMAARGWYEEILTLAGLRVGLPIDSTLLCPPPDQFSEGAEDGTAPRLQNGEQGREGVRP